MDLVLSQIVLPDGTADQFLRPLEDASADVFFANSIEDGAWWLQVMIEGNNHWWKPLVLTPEQFAMYLDRKFLKAVAQPIPMTSIAAPRLQSVQKSEQI
jgi:hypothetical protein